MYNLNTNIIPKFNDLNTTTGPRIRFGKNKVPVRTIIQID